MNGIAWTIVQKMMVDAPSYDMDEQDEEIALTENNSDDIMNYVNNMM